MTVNTTDALVEGYLNDINAAMNAGSGPGKIRIYDGARPATPSTAITTQVLLLEFVCSDPAFATASGRAIVLDVTPIPEDDGLAASAATWARGVDSDNNAVFDGSVGTSAADFIISDTDITVGLTVELVAGQITG